MSRVLNVGGDRLTAGLAEAMNISYAEAEGIKVGMPAEVQTHLEPVLATLGRELRASIDFFEHQQDKSISRVSPDPAGRRGLNSSSKAWRPN